MLPARAAFVLVLLGAVGYAAEAYGSVARGSLDCPTRADAPHLALRTVDVGEGVDVEVFVVNPTEAPMRYWGGSWTTQELRLRWDGRLDPGAISETTADFVADYEGTTVPPGGETPFTRLELRAGPWREAGTYLVVVRLEGMCGAAWARLA